MKKANFPIKIWNIPGGSITVRTSYYNDLKNLAISKVYTRTTFSHSRSEQFSKQNTIDLNTDYKLQ